MPNVFVYEMGGLKVSDVYCGNDLADVQIAPILNKLHRLFYIRCYASVLKKLIMTEPKIELLNMDCLLYMKQCEDKQFDLAIVDPPYGINMDGDINIRKPDRKSTWNKEDKYTRKDWDKETPSDEYWTELFRISKNQIVWGGNYFTDNLPVSKCWVFWDKMFDKTFNFSHGELAWTSFDKQLLKYTISSKAETRGGKDRIHPTQKPKKLYEWLLTKFSNEGDKIIDTHLGSGSIALACYDLKFDLVGIEIDSEYFQKASKRLELHKKQLTLF